mgnify:CR=1 FL=1
MTGFNEMLNHIGERIVERRDHLRMSQEDLAEKAGCSLTPEDIELIENGERSMSKAELYHVPKALKVNISYLFEEFGVKKDGTKSQTRLARALNGLQDEHEETEVLNFIQSLKESRRKQ